MDRNTITAIVLSLLVLIGWNFWYYHRYKDVIEANRQKASQEYPAALAEKAEWADSKGVASKSAFEPEITVDLHPIDPTIDPNALLEVSRKDVERATGEKRTVVDTGVAVVTLSNIGGVITSWKLPLYTSEDGEPIELVSLKSQLKPLSLEFATPDSTQRINKALFDTNAPGKVILSPNKPTFTATFSYLLETGFRLEKRLTFHHDSYGGDFEIILSHPSASVTGSTFATGWFGLGDNIKSFYSYNGPVVFVDGKRVAKKPDENEKKTYEGEVEWAGLSNKYYCVGFFPEEKSTRVTNRQDIKDTFSTSIRLVSHGSGKPIRLGFYAGPKAVNELKKEGRKFQKMINYGWLDVLSKPLYRLLVWFYAITGNFGWAIIVLTVIIKILFFPLTHKSFQSMDKMRKIQPLMKILQERYKGNKQKLNEELIALYKKHKVNPMSGCLPMLLQIPVFIALYKVLLESIELKGAGFIFWLTDLSAKDPYYVTPLLMGASMFLQQKLSPQATDPMQRNLMLAMPIVFTVMFLNFPSGLVIYWLVNNILSIAQQWFINRQKQEA